MATATVKQNGSAKKVTTAKKDVQEKLAKEAIGEKPTPITKEASKPQPVQEIVKPLVNLDDRMLKFEQMKGLAHQRERLNNTLSELNKFKYNQSDSASFEIVDSQKLSFMTTNTNLIHIVTNHLKSTLESRKREIEKQLIDFEL
ncbi:hypothetical protein [Tenacibaculum sp. M341]|uniref:hypothetical protein n=1 Tax=Tenacibaculum sp. M341 TaxID=2530339 RepID=UPI00104AC148|nr:hypothetical protein [Tenacibaculum sp. M341]TCI93600.1 hypothetical protein EYW44_04100 [Tenacibaculum sp. M341]